MVIFRFEEIGHRHVLLVTALGRGDAIEEKLDREIGSQRIETGAEEGGFNQAPLAGSLRFHECRTDAGGRRHGCRMIAKSRAKRERLLAFWHRQAADACPAPEARNVEARPVRIRPLQAISGEGTIDELRIDPAQFLIAQTRTLKTSGPDIGKKHVCIFSQFAQQLLSLGFRSVDHHGFLAAIVEVENRIVFDIGAERAEENPDRIAAGRFHFDDIGAPVAQDGSRARGGHIGGVFDDFDALEHGRLLQTFYTFSGRPSDTPPAISRPSPKRGRMAPSRSGLACRAGIVKTPRLPRRSGRAVECGGLENR